MFTEKEKHTCLNCRFYKKGAHYDCAENIDELVKDKDRPNFCEYFCLDSEKTEQNEKLKNSKSQKAEDLFNSFFNL